jgi:hypothetical protein
MGGTHDSQQLSQQARGEDQMCDYWTQFVTKQLANRISLELA